MKEISIRLPSAEAVMGFLKDTSAIKCDMDLSTHGHKHEVDAKSALGIFSLDLSRPLTLRAYTRSEEEEEQLMEAVGKYIDG